MEIMLLFVILLITSCINGQEHSCCDCTQQQIPSDGEGCIANSECNAYVDLYHTNWFWDAAKANIAQYIFCTPGPQGIPSCLDCLQENICDETSECAQIACNMFYHGCCFGDWGITCVNIATYLSIGASSTCSSDSNCLHSTGDEPVNYGNGGCGDLQCENAICSMDSYCCDNEWDQCCQALARDNAYNENISQHCIGTHILPPNIISNDNNPTNDFIVLDPDYLYGFEFDTIGIDSNATTFFVMIGYYYNNVFVQEVIANSTKENIAKPQWILWEQYDLHHPFINQYGPQGRSNYGIYKYRICAEITLTSDWLGCSAWQDTESTVSPNTGIWSSNDLCSIQNELLRAYDHAKSVSNYGEILGYLLPRIGEICFTVLNSIFHQGVFTNETECYYTIQSQGNRFQIESIRDYANVGIPDNIRLDFVTNSLTRVNVIADNEEFYNLNTSTTFVFNAVQGIGENTLFQTEMQQVMNVADKTTFLSTGQNGDESLDCNVIRGTYGLAGNMIGKAQNMEEINSTYVAARADVIYSNTSFSTTSSDGKTSIAFEAGTFNSTSPKMASTELGATAQEPQLVNRCIQEALSTDDYVPSVGDEVIDYQLATEIKDFTVNGGLQPIEGKNITISMTLDPSIFENFTLPNITYSDENNLDCDESDDDGKKEYYFPILTWFGISIELGSSSDCKKNVSDPEIDINVVFWNETSGKLEETGISIIQITNNSGILSITFTTNHLTSFAIARKIKSQASVSSSDNDESMSDRVSHIVTSLIALVTFLLLLIVVCIKICCDKMKKVGTALGILRVLILTLIFHIINEMVLIIYFSVNLKAGTKQVELIGNIYIFCILLPVIIHFWIFLIAIFSWLKLYWSTSMTRTMEYINKVQNRMIIFAIFISIFLFGGSLSIVFIKDLKLIETITDLYGLFMASFILLIGILTKIITYNLIGHIIKSARNVGRDYNRSIVFKLKITGNVIIVAFIIYSIITFISIFQNEDIYLKYDYIFEPLIKISDIISMLIVYYLYGMKASQDNKRKQAVNMKPNRISVSLSEAKKAHSARRISLNLRSEHV